MSEEKIDVKKLTLSQAIDLFLEGKIPKQDLEDAIDKRDLFKLSNKQLEDVLYEQRKNPSMFPKELRIKSSDIVYEYGRTLNASQLMNLAKEGYVTEEDILKALKKSEVMQVLAVVSEKEDDKEAEKEEEKVVVPDEPKAVEPTIEESKTAQADTDKKTEIPSDSEKTFSEGDILQAEDVATFFTGDRLVKMFFAQKMTREFSEAYQDILKKNEQYASVTSKDIIKELQEIFNENIQALYIVIMRLHFRGLILPKDVQEVIKAEFFREKIFEPSDTYDVLDKNGKVIYSYKKTSKKALKESEQLESMPDIALLDEEKLETSTEDEVTVQEHEEPEKTPVEEYPILEPITRDEVIDAYKDSAIDNDIFKSIFSIVELVQMYKAQKISAKVFGLIDKNKRKSEILNAYENGYIHLEEIMDLFFEFDIITAKELKSIIKEMPKKVAIVRFITSQTNFLKIYELYKNKLIDFNILCTLRDQGFITLEEFEEIRGVVDKDSFYDSIENKTFYTNKPEVPVIETPVVLQSVEEQPSVEIKEIDAEKSDDKKQDEEKRDTAVDISDSESVLLTKVLGIPEEELQKVSIIDSQDENGNKKPLDGYQIIGDRRDGLVIFGKFDYVSPIFVMGYDEAAYFLRSRDDEDETYIYEDLAMTDRLDSNDQVRVVEHDENIGKTIIQAICELSETARERYVVDEQYITEVMEFIKAIDEKYSEMIKETNTNM